MAFRRRMTRRRYGRRKYAKPSISTSSAAKQMSVYYDPFSTATTNPKIPDGKSYSSAGQRLQAVTEVSVNNTMDIVLFPGLNSGLSYTDGGEEGYATVPFTNHAPINAVSGADGKVYFNQTPGNAISEWRVVSQGLKITLTNNSDENDGWFEAIRLRWSAGERSMTNQTGQVPLPGSLAYTNLFQSTVIASNFVEHPTYTTGKLRDIHRHTFQLRPTTDDHDFQHIESTGAGNDDIVYKSLFDDSMDIILVRIHGRASSAGGTRLMLHYVSNQELVYDEASFLSRYQSETVYSPIHVERLKRRNTGTHHKASKKAKVS